MADYEGILTNRGVRSTEHLLSLLVVGPGELCEKISDGLHQNAKQRKWLISVSQCESIAEFTNSKTDLNIDFVIFAFDLKRYQTLSEVETNICSVDGHYIISGASCMVNCSGVSNVMGSISHRARKIFSKYNIRFLSANVFSKEDCTDLGDRILNVAEAILGLTSGIPTSLVF